MAYNSSTVNKIISSAIKSIPTFAAQGNLKYFYLKHGAINRIPNENSLSLRINSKMDMTQAKKFSFLSIWSMTHLNSLLPDYSNQKMKNVSICNPFKAYDLVEHSLRTGVQEMVIQDLDQLEKIEEIKFKIMKGTNIHIKTNYTWNIEDFQQDLELLSAMSKHSLFIHAVTCSIRQGETKKQLFGFINKLIKMGHPIRKLVVRAQLPQYLSKMNEYKQMSVPVQFQLINIDHTASFKVLCRVLGFDRQQNPVISQECKQLISIKNQSMDVLEIDGQKWLSGKPNYLSLNKAKVVDLTI